MINNTKQIAERLRNIAGLGGRVAFNHFTTPQALPFCVYNFSMNSQGADDMHTLLDISATIELYQDTRDFELEKSILKAFQDVPVNTYDDYIDDEKMYLTEFSFNFFEKN